jgi:predicted O-methyltransferase YrrM
MMDRDKITLIRRGHIAFQLMNAGVQLKLFDALSAKPDQTLEELGAAMGLQARPTRHFLRALVALGLVGKRDGKFYNPPAVEEYLVSGKTAYVGGEVLQHERLEYLSLSRLIPSLKQNKNLGLDLVLEGEGGTIYERMHLTKDRELQELFYKGMGGHSRRTVENFIASPFDMSKVHNILDFCGGDGTNAIAIAKAHPHVKITVLDFPTVCEIAQRKIDEAGLGDRIKTLGADIHTEPVPKGFDAMFLFHCSAIVSMETWQGILQRCHDAIDPGGTIVLYHLICNDEDTGPMEAAFLSLYFVGITTPEGGIYSGAEHRDALRACGFTDIERLTLPISHELMWAKKP